MTAIERQAAFANRYAVVSQSILMATKITSVSIPNRLRFAVWHVEDVAKWEKKVISPRLQTLAIALP
jgi:hypothetical protein